MPAMRRLLVLICIAAQVLVLGVMAGERELILGTGERIHLRTAPIDPRDPFRGDFVRLSYEISSAGPGKIRGELAEHAKEKGYQVYALLSKGPEDLYNLDYLTDEKPAEGIFLRGRISNEWRITRGGGAVGVKYGIEQLFVEQGSGKDIERRRGTREGLQVPMEVEVAVSSGGTAVIRDFRWSRLGMSLKMLRFHRRDRNTNLDEVTEPLSPKLEISLHNVSDAPLIVVDPGNHCGFRMERTTRVKRQYRTIYDGCEGIRVHDDDLFELAPGEVYTVALDLTDPRWHVSVDGNTGEIGRYANNDSFRIIYQAPIPGPSAAGDTLWMGELPSSAFTAFRVLD
jgi:uncharacterized membrane-anchored protein